MTAKRRARTGAAQAARLGDRLGACPGVGRAGRARSGGPGGRCRSRRRSGWLPGWPIEGVLALLQGRAEAAVEALQRAVARRPARPVPPAPGSRSSSAACASRRPRPTLRSPAGCAPSPCRKRSRRRGRSGRPGRHHGAAMTPLRAGLRQAPRRPVATLAPGVRLRETGAVEPALEVCRRALARDPGLCGAVVRPIASAARGRLCLRPQDLRRALPGEAATVP